MKTIATITALALTACFIIGCQGDNELTPDNYETIKADPNRDTAAARRHNAEAVGLMKNKDYAEAEDELKSALAADLFFGPAHNNLGTVYFHQSRYYLAAWEFQYAAKLMPSQAQPHNNLGLVFEAVGRLDAAASAYAEALALAPESTETAGNLARIHIRTNRKNEETRRLLAKIVLKDPRPPWVTWAREHLSRLGQPQPEITPPPKDK